MSSAGPYLDVIARYFYNGGLELLENIKPHLLRDVERAIRSVDAPSHKTKRSNERRTKGQMLYSPSEMNKTIAAAIARDGWKPHTIHVKTWTPETKLSYSGPRTIDGLKDRVALEIQFGKYAFMLYDMVGKMLMLHRRGIIDQGIEVVPMSTLVAEMSSGVSFFEQLKADLEARGYGSDEIPVAVLGIGISGASIDSELAALTEQRDQQQALELADPDAGS